MKRILFFATENDIAEVFDLIESKFSLHYVEVGTFETGDVVSYSSFRDIKNFGIADAEQTSACSTYMIAPKSVAFVPELVEHDGIQRIALTPKLNDQTVMIRTGGRLSPGVFISGEFNTPHETDFSKSVMRKAASLLRVNFTKVKAYWLGQEVEKAFRDGARLTAAVQSPPEYDLSDD